MTKSNLGIKRFIYTLPYHSSSLKKSGQDLKQTRNMERGADEETMEGAAYLLVLFLAHHGFL